MGSSDAKYEFEKKHKFSIAFENSSHPGYVTEKLVNAFAAQTIPIYWGDPEISKTFNTKSFINVHDYNSLDDVIAKIKEIDNDDSLYIKMMSTPALIDKNYAKKSKDELEKFITGIIDQPYEKAFRRSRSIWARHYIDELRSWRDNYKNS